MGTRKFNGRNRKAAPPRHAETSIQKTYWRIESRRWSTLSRMPNLRDTPRKALEYCFALRHQAAEREILIAKVDGKNFYAFPPYAKAPLGDLDSHLSWHESGERHAVSRYHDGHKWIEHRRIRRESKVSLQPPALLKGIGKIFQSIIFSFQFLDLRPVGTNAGQSIVIDTDIANFRSDCIGICAYLVEPVRKA
jgi:hypothetical protein